MYSEKNIDDVEMKEEIDIEFESEDLEFIEKVKKEIEGFNVLDLLTPRVKRQEIEVEYFSDKHIILSYNLMYKSEEAQEEEPIFLYQVYERLSGKSKFTHIKNQNLCATYLMNLINRCESGRYSYS